MTNKTPLQAFMEVFSLTPKDALDFKKSHPDDYADLVDQIQVQRPEWHLVGASTL